MTDYTKPFPCRECGEFVRANQKHTYKNCLKYKSEEECFSCKGFGKVRCLHCKGTGKIKIKESANK